MYIGTLNIAERAATEAARVIRRSAARIHQIAVEEKRPNDFVTEVDRQSENTIIEIISETFPTHSILSEERGLIKNETPEWLWVIDPLDGTSNFIHGLPHYSVSIACAHHGRVVLGVIVDVMRNQCFTASRGRGAFCDSRRIRTSGREHLARCLICTGIPTSTRLKAVTDEYTACLLAVAESCSGIRRSGSAALDFAWVASGYLDGFFEIGLKPWDIAAGALIVQEAGGVASDFNGTEEFLLSGNTICATPGCYRGLIPLVHKHLAECNVQDEQLSALSKQLFGASARDDAHDNTDDTPEDAHDSDSTDATPSSEQSATTDLIDTESPLNTEDIPPQTTTAAIKTKPRKRIAPRSTHATRESSDYQSKSEWSGKSSGDGETRRPWQNRDTDARGGGERGDRRGGGYEGRREGGGYRGRSEGGYGGRREGGYGGRREGGYGGRNNEGGRGAGSGYRGRTDRPGERTQGRPWQNRDTDARGGGERGGERGERRGGGYEGRREGGGYRGRSEGGYGGRREGGYGGRREGGYGGRNNNEGGRGAGSGYRGRTDRPGERTQSRPWQNRDTDTRGGGERGERRGGGYEGRREGGGYRGRSEGGYGGRREGGYGGRREGGYGGRNNEGGRGAGSGYRGRTDRPGERTQGRPWQNRDTDARGGGERGGERGDRRGGGYEGRREGGGYRGRSEGGYGGRREGGYGGRREGGRGSEHRGKTDKPQYPSDDTLVPTHTGTQDTEAPKTPKAPKTSKTSKASGVAKADTTSKETKASKTPKTSKTSKASGIAKADATVKEPKTSKTPKAPKTSGVAKTTAAKETKAPKATKVATTATTKKTEVSKAPSKASAPSKP